MISRRISVKMNVYYRMLLSYAPIFFVAISSLIFVFFTMLNRSSESRYIETNRAIVQQMMENTDANLKLIERNVVSEMLTDKLLQTFFSAEPKTLYDYYVIQKKMIDVKSAFPFVSSIYLYNGYTGKILSESGVFPLSAFGDRAFFAAAYDQPASAGWTKPREYRVSADDAGRQKVVSLVKVYPYASDKHGAVVVNVYESAISDFLNHFNPDPIITAGNTRPISSMPTSTPRCRCCPTSGLSSCWPSSCWLWSGSPWSPTSITSRFKRSSAKSKATWRAKAKSWG
jgi:hypothetical protein